MSRLVSPLARAALAACIALLVLAVCRWAPFHAEAPVAARALPLALPVVLLAALAAVTGRRRPPRPWKPLAAGAVATLVALGVVVELRGPRGLSAEVSGPGGLLGRLPPGPLDVSGPDLRALPAPHKRTLRWVGSLRVPATGTYRLWAEGRGTVTLTIDGIRVLSGEGEGILAGADVPISAGQHGLVLVLHRVGPGPRVRLGWTRPDGRSETIPPRLLGPPGPVALWWLTDLLAMALAVQCGLLVFLAPWDRPRRPPPPGPVTRREIVASLAGHTALVALMSWPLALHLAGTGMVDRPDGRLNAWILAWDVHALGTDPRHLFDAPIFHPLPDALAFSENLLLPAVAVAPAILLGGPVLGYNLALLGSLVLSGLGAQLLVRRVSGDRLAAFVGGAFFAVGPQRWIRLAHLHAQVTVFLPLALIALDRFWERRSLGRALLVGLLLALQGLSSVYLGAITATVLAVAVILALLGGLGLRALVRLGAGFALAALILAPVVTPYLRMRAFEGVEWTLSDVRTYATTLESYAASGTPLYGPLTQRLLDPARVPDALFPGLVPLILGLVGLAAAPRRYRAVALAASATAIVLSLGPATPIYRFLHEHVVLVRGIRALSRFSLIPVLALAVLSGLALAGRFWPALIALGLFLAESSHVPLRYAPVQPPSATAHWLAGRAGAVADLPLGVRDTEVMLDGVAHFRPLLNGDSGFIPRPYDREMELLAGGPTPEGLRFLRAVGVRQVVTRDDRKLPLLASFGDERIWEVPPGEASRAVAAAPLVPTLWSAGGARLDLGELRSVRGVVFEVGTGPWIAAPRVWLSADGVDWQERPGTASLADATLSLVRDPRRGRGEVRFEAARVRFVRLDPRLPARRGALGIDAGP